MNTIYKATCVINGKCYIGFDSDWPNRKHEHKYFALRRNSENVFHRAIRLHGWENFTWEIIYQSEQYKHTLKEMEPKFIKENNSYVNWENSNGYNMTFGGEGSFGLKHSDETKQKMSKMRKGIKHIVTKLGENHGRYGTHLSDETKQKLRVAMLGRKLSPEHIEKVRLKLTGFKQTDYQKQRATETMEKSWSVTNPKGESSNIINLRKFCIENGLDQGNMVKVSQGILRQHKGWKCELIE